MPTHGGNSLGCSPYLSSSNVCPTCSWYDDSSKLILILADERLNSQLEDQKKSNESLLDMIDELKKEKLELQIKADSG